MNCQIISWLTLCENDEDIFLIEALEDKTINARIEFVHADGDLDLIVGSEGGTLHYFRNTGN